MLDTVELRVVERVAVYAAMRKACRAAGGQSAWARAIGQTPQAVSDALNARRDPPDAILAALGVREA